MAEPPVVLVHGFATNGRDTWGSNGWLDLLADAGREAVAPDLLGHGDAPKPHEPEAYAELEVHLLAAFPAPVVDAIGFSLGARTLLTIASEHPERFRRLVVAGVGANLFEHDVERSSAIRAAVADGAPSDDPEVAYFAGLADEPGVDREALVALMSRPAAELTAERLAGVTVPVLVVLGDRDFAGPADPLLDALPDARLVTLRRCDHFATPKSFDFIDAALEFLDARPF